MINSRDPKELHPDVQPLCAAFLAECNKQGLDVMLTQTYRDVAYQDWLYEQGRTRPGAKVTNAKGGASMHNYRLAFDIAIKVNGKIDWDNEALYAKAGAIGKSLGLEWGGDFKTIKDTPHFQYTYSKRLGRNITLKELRSGAKL